MARDPLAVLTRLRQIETEQARRRLGQAVGRTEVALLAEGAASGALAEGGASRSALREVPLPPRGQLGRGGGPREEAPVVDDEIALRIEPEAQQIGVA
jgi:hypothetical protein